MSYTTGTLSLEFLATDGTRRTDGTVLIVPSVSLLKDTTGHKVLSGSVTVKIPKTATGPVTVDLPAFDDATLDPVGVTYTVIPPKGWGNKVTGVAINAGQTRHFADLMSADPAAVTYQPGDVTHAELAAVQTDVNGKIPLAQKGAASGVAPLDSGSRVPEANLPANLAAATLSATYARRLRTLQSALPLRQSLVDAVMATPPTVGALSTTSAIASGVTWRSVSNSNGTVMTLDQSLFAYRGGGNISVFGTPYPNYQFVQAKSITDPVNNNGAPMCIDFMFDGTTLEVYTKGTGSNFRVRVDGELVSATPTNPAANGSLYYLPITFASRATRRISIEGSVAFVFGGVVTGPNDTVWKPEVRSPRCIVIGDSFTDGTGATGGASTNWVRKFGEAMGWPDTWASGLGGTGYLNPGTGGRTTFRGRVANDVIANAPDVVVIAGGINDSSQTAAALQTEATTLISQIKAGLPNALVVVFSPFWRNGVETWPAGLFDAHDGIKAAAASFPDVLYVDFLEIPLRGAPITTTLSAATSVGANTITLPVAVPERCTIEIDTGSKRERRVVTAVAGASAPFTVAYGGITLGQAHAAGVAVKVVGNCFWTGQGKVGATTGTGNSDLFVSNDGTHPSQAGHDALGLTAARLLSAALGA